MRETQLKYLVFSSQNTNEKRKSFGIMFPSDFTHKTFGDLIIKTHPYYKDLKIMSGGFIKYNPIKRQFSTIGKSISCKVESNPNDIVLFQYPASKDLLDW